MAEYKVSGALIQSGRKQGGPARVKAVDCAQEPAVCQQDAAALEQVFNGNGACALLIGIYYNWCSYLVTARDKHRREGDRRRLSHRILGTADDNSITS